MVEPKDCATEKPDPMEVLTCAGVAETTLLDQILYATPSAPIRSTKNWIVGLVPCLVVKLMSIANSLYGPTVYGPLVEVLEVLRAEFTSSTVPLA
jgi:hypothetical protein